MANHHLSEEYPRQLAEAELRLIERRRAAAAASDRSARGAGGELGENGLPLDAVGVALSGGGIRSATFCLGVFRAFARLGLLGRIDFMSTVSGGGYFGSFLGGLFVPRDERGRVPADERERARRSSVAQVRRTLLDLRSEPVDWLRENGRYMAPNGAGDLLLAGAILLRNWLTVLAVLCSLLFTLLTGVSWLVALSGWRLADPSLSPFLAVPAWLAFVAVIPLAWAFWLTQPFGSNTGYAKVPPFLLALAPLLAVLLPEWRRLGWTWLPAVEGAAALAWWGIATVVARVRDEGGAGPFVVRNRLSRWLSLALWSALALLAFAALDTVGLLLARPDGLQLGWKAAVSAVGVLFAAFAAVQKAGPLLGSLSKAGGRLLATPTILVGAAAVLVGATLLTALATLVHRVPPSSLGLALAAAAVVTVLFAWTLPFLNLSSHNSLYGARLARAYLGASNERRHAHHIAITELVPGDRIRMADYDPTATGGPLHLINVTLNETVSGKSQIEQRDRKGLGMAVGPCGISVARRHHALWTEGPARALSPLPPADPQDFQVFTAQPGRALVPEPLDLGDWISISGAAFTTGLGTRTSLSLSLLMGLANVRLGYWWSSGVSPRLRYQQLGEREPIGARVGRWLSDLLPVHAYLLDEVLARFHGPARTRWYLSDGGHAENTGAFELVRRRIPFIILCDAGCDPQYEFGDVANLARRVRTDLDAELAFLTREQLTEVLPADVLPYFGTVDDFKPGSGKPRPHALLAGVFYQDPLRERQPGSVILVLKPGSAGDEPADVVEYGRRHTPFPQEPTADQFFDEAQWESYRRLGEHIASRVFGKGAGKPWRPWDFCAPPLAGMRWLGADVKSGDGAHPGRAEELVPAGHL